MIRILILAGGLAGAATLSQYPEFSQQYMQRLAGQVDALTVVVRDFDTSALATGLGREDALAQMTGAPFLIARQADMRRTFARHAVLSDNLAALRAAGPVARLAMPQRLGDTATLRATLGDFQPALPLSVAGIAAGGLGFGGGAFAASLLLGLILLPFRQVRVPRDTLRTRVRVVGGGRAGEAPQFDTQIDSGAKPRHDTAKATPPGPRPEPPVARPRPTLVADAPPRPRLMGEKR